MSKKGHLQGIRAIAIISVLAFHFFPKFFPNGFLGVDQFFVLSGYLMCQILSKNQNQSIISKIFEFYQRRLCRILPNYYFLILINQFLLIFPSIFPETFIETNQKSAKQSIFFVSNDFSNLEDDYYILLKIAENLFTHTWSLSVEIQFYFMIPIVFYTILSISGKSENFKKTYLLLSAISLIFYLISSKSTAFYSVFARIWQFLAGFLVYFLAENEKEEENKEDLEKLLDFEEEKEQKTYENAQTWLLLVTILMLFVGFEYPERIVRIFITIITALLILISENNQILSNKIMIYIGNISYSLYLIHWPIYCYSKFYELPKLPFLILSIFLAIIIHETYEKWYTTRLTRTSQSILCAILLIFCVGSIWRQEIHNFYWNLSENNVSGERNSIFLAGNSKNLSLEEIMELNTKWTLKENEFLMREECDYERRDLKPFGLCKVRNLSSSAPYKILILGNSYATNLAPLIIKSCRKKSRQIWLVSHPGCDFLHQGFAQGKCPKMWPNSYGKIQSELFDFVFLIAKCGDFCENHEEYFPIFKNLDRELEFAKSQISRIRNFVRHKIFIQNAVTIPSGVRRLNDFLKNHTSFDEIDKIYSQRLKHHKKIGDARHRKLAKFCGEKCEYFDAFSNFTRNPWAPEEIFQFFDERGLEYVDGADHFTPFAWPKIQPVFDGICERI
ncbi:unnamed protein product [Caenorhabditis angaria]|uniref:Acyl_transf_3 domain-containing protein n=1 Tax=Caenorhabditis angaria TaxID=860376 RepID=A0A9P1IWD1_9PELO|nr:unnamed protein product [Caenorhabditis angaria]